MRGWNGPDRSNDDAARRGGDRKPVRRLSPASRSPAGSEPTHLGAGGAFRLFSYHVASAVKDGKLGVLLESFEPPPLPVNIAYMGGGLLPLKVRAFLDFVAPGLKVRLAADLA